NAFKKAEDEIAEGTGNTRVVGKFNRLPLVVISSIVIILAIIVGGYYLFVNENPESSENKQVNAETTKNADGNTDEHFVNGMRYKTQGDYEKAKESFRKSYYTELDEADQNMIIDMYIEHEDYQEAIDDFHNADAKIIDKLYQEKDSSNIRQLKPTTTLLELEQAILNRDYIKITELTENNHIDMNDRRAKAVAQAYHRTGEDEKASQFTDEMLAENVDPFSGEQPFTIVEGSDTSSNTTSVWSIILWSVLTIIVLIILIVAILYLFRNRIPYRLALAPANHDGQIAISYNKGSKMLPIIESNNTNIQSANENELLPATLFEDEYEKIDKEKEFIESEKDYIDSIKRTNENYAHQLQFKEKEILETQKEIEQEKEKLSQQSQQNQQAAEYYKVLKKREEKQKEERDRLYEDMEKLQNELVQTREKYSELERENQEMRNMLHGHEVTSNEQIDTNKEEEALISNEQNDVSDDTINVDTEVIEDNSNNKESETTEKVETNEYVENEVIETTENKSTTEENPYAQSESNNKENPYVNLKNDSKPKKETSNKQLDENKQKKESNKTDTQKKGHNKPKQKKNKNKKKNNSENKKTLDKPVFNTREKSDTNENSKYSYDFDDI